MIDAILATRPQAPAAASKWDGMTTAQILDLDGSRAWHHDARFALVSGAYTPPTTPITG